MKLFRILLGLLALGIFTLSAGKLLSDFREKEAGAALNESLKAAVVRTAETVPVLPEVPETEPVPTETAPIAVDFALLRDTNPQVAGWLYCPDTPIDLPVAQGTDNEWYLCHLFDGTPNNTGTLFVDAENAEGFSDPITVIYGHNLKNGTMFGTLTRYKDPEYLEAHPAFWLLTPEGSYRVALAAGCVVPADDPLYAQGHRPEEVLELIKAAMDRSTFSSREPVSEQDRFLVLSTCSYEFENARYVLIGRLIPVG